MLLYNNRKGERERDIDVGFCFVGLLFQDKNYITSIKLLCLEIKARGERELSLPVFLISFQPTHDRHRCRRRRVLLAFMFV